MAHVAPAEAHAGHELSFWRKYIFSQDHKVIGIQYAFTSMFMAVLGGLLAMFIRLQLGWPGRSWPILGNLFPGGMPDGQVSQAFYLAAVTMHGTIMIFFVLTTLLTGGFGNFLIPLMIGARDMAFPFLNMLSYWLYPPAIIILLASFFVSGGAAGGGARVGAGPDSLADQPGPPHPRLPLRFAELHHHDPAAARARPIDDAPAADDLGFVRHGHPLAAGLPGAAGRGDHAALRPDRRHELLRPGGPAHRERAGRPPRGESAALAAPLLVPGPPRGVRSDPAADGHDLGYPGEQRAQADLRLPFHGRLHRGHRLPVLPGLGAPHVHERHGPGAGHRVYDHHARHRRALGDQDLQLAGQAG